MRFTKRGATSAVAASFLVLMGTGTAHADTGYTSCTNSSQDPGGENCTVYYRGSDGSRASSVDFIAYGEHVYMYDEAADGKGIYAQLRWGSTPLPEKWLTAGYGTSTEFNIPAFQDGTNVPIRVCQTNAGQLQTCITMYPVA
ncbi:MULTISPECIES: hypothetical protein [unclassified Streptomyces]|uniref:hypothetical protein n=1 Tax=unclassified Streptomyces TaxID=2593676 RepID=UPI00278BBA28|nr:MULTISPECIES: hypothetical protein [unclassified Streptomyces]